MSDTTETRLHDAIRLLDAAAIELHHGETENAARGIEAACARLMVVGREVRAEVAAKPDEADTQLVYHDSVGIVAVPVEPSADKWEARDTALLIRPQGHCVTITSPSGERWNV